MTGSWTLRNGDTKPAAFVVAALGDPADDVVVFSGWLGAGGATDWSTANVFVVTTTDDSLTLFENPATGHQFSMGGGLNETYDLGG